MSHTTHCHTHSTVLVFSNRTRLGRSCNSSRRAFAELHLVSDVRCTSPGSGTQACWPELNEGEQSRTQQQKKATPASLSMPLPLQAMQLKMILPQAVKCESASLNRIMLVRQVDPG